MSMLHTKGTRGWMRALVIVMVSLSLTLSMPAKPAMAVVLVPTIDGAAIAKLGESLAQQLIQKLINMAIQKATQEIVKATGSPELAEIALAFTEPVMKYYGEKLEGMATRGVGDMMVGLRTPKQNFADCMNSFACQSNIKFTNDFATSFNNPFSAGNPSLTFVQPSSLPPNLRGQYGEIAVRSTQSIPLAGPVSIENGFATGTLANGAGATFLPSNTFNPSATAIPAGTVFTTPPDALNMKGLWETGTLNVSVPGLVSVNNLPISEGAASASAPPTVTASPQLAAAVTDANKTNQPKTFTVAGQPVTVKPGQFSVSGDGNITGGGTIKIGDVETTLNGSASPGGVQGSASIGANFGGLPVTASITQDGKPAVKVDNLAKVMCLGSAANGQNAANGQSLDQTLCPVVGTALNGALNCALSGGGGNCLKNSAKNAGVNLAQSLAGAILNQGGVPNKQGGSAELQAAAAAEQIRKTLYCTEPTAECSAFVSGARNDFLAGLNLRLYETAYKLQLETPTEYAQAFATLEQMGKQCKGGNTNCLMAQQLFLKQWELSQVIKWRLLEAQRVQAQVAASFPTAPLTMPPKM
jgi:hypothetical protein